MTRYRPAPDVELIATELIPAHHRHLADCTIRYLHIDPPPVAKGQTVWGHTTLVQGRAAYLAAMPGLAGSELEHASLEGRELAIFVIEIAELVWHNLAVGERRALIDHELSHCFAGEDLNGERRLATRGHDVEEFQAVLERHGIWRPELRIFARTVEQLTLEDHWS